MVDREHGLAKEWRQFIPRFGVGIGLPCISTALLIGGLLYASVTMPSHAGTIEVEYHDLEMISVSADGAPAADVFRALQKRMGFDLIDRTEGACGVYTGRVYGSFDKVIQRISQSCDYIIRKEFDSGADNAGARIKAVYLLSGSSGSTPRSVIQNDPAMIGTGRSSIIIQDRSRTQPATPTGETPYERQLRELRR